MKKPLKTVESITHLTSPLTVCPQLLTTNPVLHPPSYQLLLFSYWVHSHLNHFARTCVSLIKTMLYWLLGASFKKRSLRNYVGEVREEMALTVILKWFFSSVGFTTKAFPNSWKQQTGSFNIIFICKWLICANRPEDPVRHRRCKITETEI